MIRYQILVSFHLTARTKSELELSVNESGNEELYSELTPDTGRSFPPDDDGKPGRGLPSIDD